MRSNPALPVDMDNAALFHGLNSSFEAVAKEIRDELLKDVDENDFVAETHEIHFELSELRRH